ncbi:hypothetical protein P22_3343 [Propionispora sp. 2/2-37]|uniref:phosphate ABC transporter substrate-binding protein n=1 Tax=Propionispora sp. 2/2-37 TaxID=1677858 RepID=UPI0006BB8F59|nr:phosphate ABC transporter substrate-binding protein [Propionispora sp. 2/2-37]CUH97216.1 hypothetical protein P22_3343 [Propionispora sp. 2/2-37]
MWKKVLVKKILVGLLTTVMLGGAGVPAMAAGTLTMSGSTSVQPLAEDLAAGFKLKFPNTLTFTITGGGSGVGIADVAAGRVDIGNVSRNLKPAEIAQGLVATTIARDAIAVVVHPNNPVQNLSYEDVVNIFDGTYTNWSEVPNSNFSGPIHVDSRTAPSGTLDFFKEYFTGKGYALSDIAATNLYESNGLLRSAVAGDQYAIGFLSLGYVNGTVKAPKLNNVTPSQGGGYDFIRNFNMVTKGQPQIGSNTKLFLDYVLSADGQAIVTQDYLAPLAGGSASAAKGQVRQQRQQRQLR